MADLEAQLQAATAAGKRHKVIVTDGVFSMDGTIAQLDKICDLADKYGALTMIDESHASGFMGKTGRGTHEHHNVMGRIDIITGTLGKALGGAMGGFTSGAQGSDRHAAPEVASLPVLEHAGADRSPAPRCRCSSALSKSTELRDRLHENTAYFRKEIERIGFTIKPGTHPVVPVMLFEAPVAQKFAARMYELGVLLSGFFYPVVPMGQARVRVQLSAAHTREQLETRTQGIRTGRARAGHPQELRTNQESYMERILIIGANGQIGSELVERAGRAARRAERHRHRTSAPTNVYKRRALRPARRAGQGSAWRNWSPTKASPRSTSWRRCCRPPAKRRR